MRFEQFFLLAPALLVAAQQQTSNTNSGASSSASGGSSASGNSASSSSSASSSQSSSSSSSAASSSSSGGGSGGSGSSQSSGGDSNNIVTTTFGGGIATLLTNAGGNIVGTVHGAAELESTLRGNDNLGTLMSSVPQTVYTTSASPSNTNTDSKGNPTGVYTTSFGGRATLLTNGAGDIVATIHGPQELASSLRGNDNLGTVVTSVPETTYTTSAGATPQTQDQSGNAAPVATAAQYVAGGVIGAGLMVVGLL